MKALLAPLLDWYAQQLQHYGYWLVGLLMTIESTLVPVPSEVIIPPAAYLAHTHPEGGMSVPGVVLAGALGSWAGAAIMYWAARLCGRPLLLRWGRLARLTPAKIEAVERWSARYGSFGIFFSRLLPVVRHLIGLPSGLVRLPFGRYSLYTLLGSGLWCSVLAWIGIKAGADQDLMKGDITRVTLWAVGAFLVLGTLYWAFVHRHMRPKGARPGD
jgi:membrane protein DedA with SNARE-associated domain